MVRRQGDREKHCSLSEFDGEFYGLNGNFMVFFGDVVGIGMILGDWNDGHFKQYRGFNAFKERCSL